MIFLLLLTPLLAAGLSCLVPRDRRLRLELVCIVAAILELVVVLFLGNAVLASEKFNSGNSFAVDGLGLLLLGIISIVGFAASVYSVGYLREEFQKNIIGFTRVRQYYALFHAFVFAMILAVVTTNPMIMWISIEATTLSTAFLISFYNKPSASEAAWKYLIINSVGLLLAFLGTLMFLGMFSQEGLNWSVLMQSGSTLHPLALKVAFIFILVGFGTKVGFVPLHTWRPDSYAKAPVPVAALLSGVLLSVVWIAILRFKLVTDISVGPEFSQKLLLLFGILSIVVASLIMLVQKNYKRMLAYSSIEHVGIIALGFGFGGVGALAALLHIFYHAIVKSLLFLASGNVFLKYSSTKLQNIQGVLTSLPITGVLFFGGIIALVGLPPFGIFFTKFSILASGVHNYLWIVVLVSIMLAVVFIALLKHASSMLFGPVPEGVAVGEGSFWTLVPLLFLALVLVVSSLAFPDALKDLLLKTVSAIS